MAEENANLEVNAEGQTEARPVSDARWYVVHTYSGYENRVKTDLENTVKNRNLEEQIREVMIPMQDVVENRGDGHKVAQRKMFPSYVLVNMVMNDDTWFVVRNTRGVTGFVGPGSRPVPLSDEDMRNLGVAAGEVVVDFAVGDTVIVVKGVWEATTGVVESVNISKQTLTISVEMFGGRKTSVELDFSAVRKM